MAKKSKLVKYVHEYLEHELRLVSSDRVGTVESELSLEERTLIYKYSEDGYEGVNYSLRNSLGQTSTQFGKYLELALRKLPGHKGLVYRNANLSSPELERYIQAFEKNSILVEHTFISISISYNMLTTLAVIASLK